jgi:DNA (cytosine-5)-methyltransferase 1
MKVLNLYSGIGGNRKLWQDVEVTAVEHNPDIARIYKDFFPKDTVIVGDAHEWLLKHYSEFDFIWTSPPCPTHSQFRYRCGFLAQNFDAVYPDMKLYEEIIFLQHYFKGLYVVENVESFYEPLIAPQKVARHYFWANFFISKFEQVSMQIRKNRTKELSAMHGFDLSDYDVKDKVKILRNCVSPEVGRHVLESAFNNPQKTLFEVKEAKQDLLFI